MWRHCTLNVPDSKCAVESYLVSNKQCGGDHINHGQYVCKLQRFSALHLQHCQWFAGTCGFGGCFGGWALGGIIDCVEAGAAVLSPAQQHKSTAEVHVLSMIYMVSSSLPQLSPITNVVEGLVIVTAPDVILDSESTPNMYGSEPA